MTDSRPPTNRRPPPANSLSPTQMLRIHAVCVRFEEAWKAGREPRLEDYLTEVADGERPALLRELLWLDLHYRGPAADAADYEARFPTDTAVVRAVFAGRVARPVTIPAGPHQPDEPDRTPFRPNTVGGSGSAPSAAVGDDVLGFEILSELGRGRMGVVYRARQVKLNRTVALKMVLGAGSGGLIRFLAEAEAVAAVRHPGVVQVYEYGEAAGRPYMALEYLSGGTLAERLKRDGRLDPRPAAALLAKVAAGVAAAHAAGIVHRDLKPGNVLLDAAGGPKVADFGLAKRAAGEELTRTGAVMGTPAYMAPEQAAGRTKFVGPQADVWALGVILYECVAGERPFAGESVQVLLARIQTAEPRPLRSRVRAVPRDLETIAAKCLGKEPVQRYPSAAELADDLGRFVRGEPITARPVGPAERLVRWVRRKPTAAAAYGVSAVAVALAAVVFVVLGFWRDAEAARDQLDGEKRRTETARVEAVRLQEVAERAKDTEAGLRADADAAKGEAVELRGVAERAKDTEHDFRMTIEVFRYGRTTQLAYQELRGNDVVHARWLAGNTDPLLRNWEWRYVHRLCHASLLDIAAGQGVVAAIQFTRDGSRVLVAGSNGSARLWDAVTGALVWEFALPDECAESVAFSPDESRVAVGFSQNLAVVWDVRTGEKLHTLGGHDDRVASVAFSPDGSRIVTASRDRTAKVWDWDGKEARVVRTLAEQKGTVFFAVFSPDGSRILTGGIDGPAGPARVWDAATGKEVHRLEGHATAVYAGAFSPDGSRILTGGGGLGIAAKVWDSRPVNYAFLPREPAPPPRPKPGPAE